jgi:hypothetical protein
MLIIGAAKEIVSQQAVVGGAVVVKELHEWFHVLHGERLIGTVTLIDAVEVGSHTVAVGLRRAADHRHQEGKYK